VKDAVRDLAKLIEEVSGIDLPDRDLGRLEKLVSRRLASVRCDSIQDYVRGLLKDPGSPEWPCLLNQVTIKESYFFRGEAHFEAMAEIVIPELVNRRPNRRLKIWSAGRARGEEAATLAIVLAESTEMRGWDWDIVATDVDSKALVEAREGVFGRRAVAGVPAELLTRYFTPIGDRVQLVPELRARIEYRPLNLTEPRPELGERRFDIVFLRNVLIYFRPEVQKSVVSGVARDLVDDGYLFLGPSESLMFLGSDLRARDLGSCFCYQHPGSSGAAEAPNHLCELISGESTSSAPPDRLMSKTTTPLAAAQPVFEEQAIEDRLELVIGTLEEKEFSATLKHIERLRDQLPESSILHALEGLVLERGGEQEKAVQAYRAALYLDSEIKEVRFLLARGLEVLGRKDRAAREYRATLAALGSAREETPTVFSRLGLPTFRGMAEACREALQRIK
jgi:chemotaxis protein methyltransferase CheR